MKLWKPTFLQGVLLLIVVGLSVQLYSKLKADYLAYQAEEARLSTLDKDSLDLPFIVTTIDALDGEDLQLNWKEIVAIIGVTQSNYVANISEETLETVALQFIDQETIRSFDEVVATYNYSEKDLQRVHQYLEDLTYYGYTPDKLQPESREATFIERVKPAAIKNYHQYQILPSITIAQAILESNWGESQLAQTANNLFGVKVGYGWTGEVAAFQTREFYDTFIEDQFRKYEEPGQSITDHAKFLVENPRYAKAGVFEMKTYSAQAKALEEAGYSTAQDEDGNPTYAKMLGQLIRQYNLQLIDHDVLYS